jgi:hypothetical protein
MTTNFDNILYLRDDPSQYAPLTDMEPVQLVSAELIEAFWPLARPYFERCVREAMHGEYLVDDLKAMALAGQLVLIVVTNDRTGTNPHRTVELALAVEPVRFPRLPAINILALGGTRRGLMDNERKFGAFFRGWAVMNGAKVIEASVSDRMQRVLRRWGFINTYHQMRYRLLEG